ncbi:MAG: DUF975 family protein [Lachnospiraceae bacterium]
MHGKDVYKQEAAEIVRSNYWVQTGAFLIRAPLLILAVLFGGRSVQGILILLLLLLLWNIATVGLCWFTLRSQRGQEQIRDVYTVLGDHLFNVILTMALRDLVIAAFCVLLVVPGIQKAYSLRLVPYILAERPDTKPLDALRESGELTQGQRGKLFLLDVSFLGWLLLTVATCGIVGIFWTGSYYGNTNGLVYAQLRDSYDTRTAFTDEDYDDDGELDEDDEEQEERENDAYGTAPEEPDYRYR